jgi:hypothetical protein
MVEIWLTVCLPAAPGFGKVLQNCLRLVLPDRFRHHVKDIVYYSSTQFKVKMGFHGLLCYRFGHALTIETFELSSEEVPKPKYIASQMPPDSTRATEIPSFEEWNNSSREEQPHAPPRGPETATRSLAYGASIEPIVNEMFQVFCHSHLTHQLVLVATQKFSEWLQTQSLCIHTGTSQSRRQCERKYIGQISELERIHVASDVRIDHELGEPNDLRMISRQRWKAFPKRDFFLSLVIRVLTGLWFMFWKATNVGGKKLISSTVRMQVIQIYQQERAYR